MRDQELTVIFEKATKSREHFYFTSFYHLPRREQSFLHCHEVLELGVCLSGNGECLLGTRTIPYKAGDVQVIPPYLPHYDVAYTDDTLWAFINVDIPRISASRLTPDPAFLIELAQNIHTFGVFSNDTHPKLHALITEISHHLRPDTDGNTLPKELAVAKLITLLIELSYGNLTAENPLFSTQQTKRLLPALYNVSDSLKAGISLTPKQMADSCFMSESHFRRLFTSTMGESPKSYISRMRSRQAASLLLYTDLSVAEISTACGFENTSTFYRCFLHAYGISPREYRKKR